MVTAYIMSTTTHPTIAALGHPLFACGGKRDGKTNENYVIASAAWQSPRNDMV